MRIVLEQEDVRFATTACYPLGNIRWLLVTVGGKQFFVHRTIDPGRLYMDEDKAKAEIDKLLIREMEHMLAKMFREAAAAVPDGPMEVQETETWN